MFNLKEMIKEILLVPLVFPVDFSKSGKWALVLKDDEQHHIRLELASIKQETISFTPITTDHLHVWDGKISSDESLIAFTDSVGGTEQHHLFITPLTEAKAKRISTEAGRNAGFCWHPQNNTLFWQYTAKKGFPLISYNIDTEVYTEHYSPKLMTVLHSISPNAKWLALSMLSDPRKGIEELILYNTQQEEVVQRNFDEKEPRLRPMCWSKDSRQLLVTTQIRDRVELYLVDTNDINGQPRLIEIPTPLSISLTEGMTLGFGAGDFYDNDKKILFAAENYNETQLYSYQLEEDHLVGPIGNVHGSSYPSKVCNESLLLIYSSGNTPRSLHLLNLRDMSSKPLWQPSLSERIPPLKPFESVWYKSFDNRKIHGWYLPPNHPEGLNRGALIYPHGGPTYAVYNDFIPQFQALSLAGFAIFAPNFRGSTGYGKEFTEIEWGDLGGGDLEDIVEGARWLQIEKKYPSSRIGIQGYSYGGYITLLALTKKPNVFAAGSAQAGISDWLESWSLSDLVFQNIFEQLFKGTPNTIPELLKDRSPITWVNDIKSPIQIIHPKEDSRTPLEPIEKFIAHLEEKKHPYEMMLIEAQGHWISDRTRSLEWQLKMIEFFERQFS